LINEDKYKTLNAVLFGEGVVNDAVSILLYRAIDSSIRVNGVGQQGGSALVLSGQEVLQMCVGFATLSFSSIILGIVFGLLCSLLLKVIPKLEH
jgi:NhaP-type Na+/H+ or K+/H+ antiporter